ncbi:hypothetical protein IT570_05745 [Candidatus Sumerlaeota bacterium]|nr:hypothetical protein [Candidatus Sumerlaeota bacterium]
MRLHVFLLVCIQMTLLALAPAADWTKSDLGEMTIVPMKSAPYPHDSRKEDVKKGETVYTVADHYSDPSVLIFIPAGYKPGEKTDLFLYFHGHKNNVRNAVDVFKLREQVVASRKNVILVCPEGPKDAPDSGLGKLEDRDGLKNLLAETLQLLEADGKIPTATLGHVVLSGHSGGYYGVAMCLKQGGVEANLSEVYLIDAAYGNIEEFSAWATRNKTARLCSIYTDHLQAKNESIMSALKESQVAYESKMDTEVDEEFLKAHRIVFLHTKTLSHSDTVTMVEKFLRTGALPNRPS